MRVFRTDQYQVAIQAQAVEQGLTFILTVDYDKFREILERRKEKKQLKEAVKAEQEMLAPDNNKD